MELMFITNEAEVAKTAEHSGVDIIFIDLEKNGKQERQGHLDTHIADHKVEDIGKIKNVINKSKILARINPYYEKTKYEIDRCVEQGADIIMLPMFKTRFEAEEFIRIVDSRAEVCLLLETPQAMVRINEIVELSGIDRIHVGLNDLHLSSGLDFMFELLSGGIVEYLGKIITNQGIKFGFGGIARIGDGDVPAELIIAEHYRLNSKMTILSRAFRSEKSKENLHKSIFREIEKIRNCENEIMNWTDFEFESNKNILQEKVRMVARRKYECL